MSTIMAAFDLPADLLERPRVAIRVIERGRSDPIDIINSFYLRDLHSVRTAFQAGAGGATLAAYLGQARPARPLDVLADKAVLESLVAPALTPGARWPAPRPAKLVTLQQAAVNAAVRDLADGGLLSINGPPGTGKTTLLRDVIAAVLEARADVLVALDDPESAFSPVELVAESGRNSACCIARRRPWPAAAWWWPRPTTPRSAMSAPNCPWPRRSAIPPPSAISPTPPAWPRAATSDCWGLVAAVLGNRKNRVEFVESVWWDPDWGLEKYLAAVNGRVDVEPPAIVTAEAPPRTRGEARERWRRAQMDYRERKSAVARLLAGREQMRLALADAAAVQQALEDALAAEAAAQIDGRGRGDRGGGGAGPDARRGGLADARRLHDGGAALRPGWVARLVGQDDRLAATQARTLAVLEQAMADQAAARAEQDAADQRARDATDRGDAGPGGPGRGRGPARGPAAVGSRGPRALWRPDRPRLLGRRPRGDPHGQSPGPTRP
jgi:hypothetical protein